MPLETFTIPEASISIYPVDALGLPITSSPIWLGACATGLQISESLTEVIDYPTGVTHGQAHHTDEQHSIAIDRLWVVDVTLAAPPANITAEIVTRIIGGTAPVTNGTDYRLRRNQKYIAIIVWQDGDDPNRFIYRVYYGVTDRKHNLSGSGVDGEIGSQIEWRAEYYL